MSDTTTLVEGLGGRGRPRGPRRAGHRHQAVLRLPQRVRLRAQHQRLPGVPRAAGLAAGASTARRSSSPCASAGRWAAGSSPRPSPGRTTSTRTCRRTTRSASTTCRSTSTACLELPDGFRVGIERAHMEEDTGKSTHVGGGGRIHDADHSLVDYNRAGVPLRRDRQPARPAHRRPGPGLRQRAAGDPGGHRRVRRPHGGGLDAGRRQRLGAPRGRRDPRHPLRGQEPQLDPLARPGHRLRGPPPDRPARGRGAGRPGDPALERGRGSHPHPALQGGGLRLPVLPRAGPGAAGPGRRLGEPGRGRRCPCCPPRGGPRWPTLPGSAPRTWP